MVRVKQTPRHSSAAPASASKVDYGTPLPRADASRRYKKQPLKEFVGNTYGCTLNINGDWSLEELKLGYYSECGVPAGTYDPKRMNETNTGSNTGFNTVSKTKSNRTPYTTTVSPSVLAGLSLPPAKLSEGFFPQPMAVTVFSGPEMEGKAHTITTLPSREKWSLEELRLGYIQGRTPSQKLLESFSQSKVSKSFNATTTTCKKAEHLLWLAKAKKINKITLLEFQMAKQKVLRSDFSVVEGLVKKTARTAKAGVKELLVVVADLFRREIINSFERKILKRHFFTTDCGGASLAGDALGSVKATYKKLFKKDLHDKLQNESIETPSPPNSDGRSCLGVVLQHLSAMKNSPFAAQLKRDVFQSATTEEKKKGSGDKATIKSFLGRISFESNPAALDELKRRAVGPTLPADLFGKILFVLGRMQQSGKITAQGKSELKKYYVGRMNGRLWADTIRTSLLIQFAKEFSRMTGFPQAPPSAQTAAFVSPKKELLSAAYRMRKAGDGFLPYILKTKALKLTPSMERSLIGKPHSTVMTDLPDFMLPTVTVLTGSVPVPHPRTVQATSCVLVSMRYLPMVSSKNRTVLKDFALTKMKFPLGSNAVAHFASHFYNTSPILRSLGFTAVQFGEACQRACGALSFSPVVGHVIGKPLPSCATDTSSLLGPVNPPQPASLTKPQACKGFQGFGVSSVPSSTPPSPSAVCSVSSGPECGLVGPALLKASLFVLADFSPDKGNMRKSFLKKAILKVFFGSGLKAPTYADIEKHVNSIQSDYKMFLMHTFRHKLASLDPAKHSFLEGKRPFSAPGGGSGGGGGGKPVTGHSAWKMLNSAGSRSSLPEMVLLVGFPGSGKSTFYKQNLSSTHERINQDTLLTKERCYAAARAALKQGKSIVIDNTNPAPHTRKPYIDIAKEENVSVRAITLVVDLKVAFERNVKRFESGGAPLVPKITYAMFKKAFRDPTLSEGFCLVETYSHD